MSYNLNKEEKKRFERALRAAISIPFMSSVGGYALEAIWAYAKGVENSINSSKQLFDVTDSDKGIGWSVKSIERTPKPNSEFEVVIQRADVINKANELGFPGLTINSTPNLIGKALLKHWKLKVDGDAATQGVTNKRIMVLLKSKNRKKYAIIEDKLHIYESSEMSWEWTNINNKKGLQGKRNIDGVCIYRWYPSQAQFFERFVIPVKTHQFLLEPKRLGIEKAVEILVEHL
jgi:hypothetical protein